VLSQADVPDAGAPGTWRRLLARRGSA
jgi:hypothetical protein